MASSPPVRSPLRWPRWTEEVDLTLPICAQYVLYGNVRDSFLIPYGDRLIPMPLVDCLWQRLQPRGFRFLLLFEQSTGVRVYPANAVAQAREALRDRFPLEPGGRALRPDELRDIVEAAHATPGCALLVQNASRLVQSAAELSDVELRMFAACARSTQLAGPHGMATSEQHPLFSPVFWLLDNVNDLPDWLIVAGERGRAISIATPDEEARYDYARSLIQDDPDEAGLSKRFAAQTEGLSLNEMAAVAQLARDRRFPPSRFADAIRAYKVGVVEDPWSKPLLMDRIAQGEAIIREHVKGQPEAVRQTLDILIRSMMGLHGAQASSSSARPRGVLFFAGPTGVGKTELAKAVSRLVFEDIDACRRFDMSEFSSEHSDARLIGAPPGYVGHDAGGELVNAIRQRPFSVILFDEIEKAHPRILDKFLQILEDGRLTDGRGDTVYFSEAVLIFTSNLGIMRTDERGKRVPAVTYDTPHPEVARIVREAIEDHFRSELQRPELLNRIGQNIVIFDFIRPDVAEQIFDNAIINIFTRVRGTRNITLAFGPGVREELLRICTADLQNGGRGIGNMLEIALINPLARTLFLDPPTGASATIVALRRDGNAYSVVLA